MTPSSLPASAIALTDNERRALDAIELHGGFRRTELTPGEKRTATRLEKRQLIARYDGWYVTTVVGRVALKQGFRK